MKLNSKVTWGLAWTGLAVVLAVPSADFLTSQFGGRSNSAAVITSTTDPVKPAATAPTPAAPAVTAPTKTASVTTTVTKNRVTITPNGTLETTAAADPVDKLLKGGKKLPDYITDGSTPTAPAQAPSLTVKAPVVVPDTTQVANVPAAAVAPVPFPARPAVLDQAALPTRVLPKSSGPTVIVDEASLPTSAPPTQLDVPERIAIDRGPVPPAAIPDDWRTARERRLQRYLENNGLIDGGAPDGRSSASVTIVDRPPPDYDADGFYLSDGPNNSRAARRARIEQMLADDRDDDSGFTLF